MNFTPYAVTNTHCGKWGEWDEYQWGQPNSYFGYIFAYEYDDVPWYPCGWFNTEKCRNSDTSVLQITGLSHIVESVANVTTVGSTVIDPNEPYLTLAYEVTESLMNDPVEKIGSTTGRTTGIVTNTCVDLHVWGNDHALACQDKASYDSADGDSGSPVFYRMSENEAVLYGVHHSGHPFGGAYFSPMWLIHWDYPYLMALRH